jgi:hypothetical protein
VDVRAVLADVAELGPYFAVTPDPGIDGAGWRPVRELYADPAPVRERIAQVGTALGSDARVAASIAFQGLAAQLVSAPFAAVALHGVLPRLGADALRWRSVDSGPWPLGCAEPAGDAVGSGAAGGAALAALLLVEHLQPLVAVVREQSSIAERVLWGNAASALAGAKRMVGVTRPEAADAAARLAATVLDVGPLRGAGEKLPPIDPDRGWTFRRRSCCLYYRVGGLCEDCVLLVDR